MDLESSCKQSLFQGRPNLEQEILESITSTRNNENSNNVGNNVDSNNDNLVFACGPNTLTNECNNICTQHDILFKSEVFEL